jgi:Spy/CpxP family protein refolding chaperone
MKTRILAGILLFLIIINLATLGTYIYQNLTRPSPDNPALSPPMGSGMRYGRMHVPPPNMTAEQRTKLHAVMEDFRGSCDSLERSAQGLEREIVHLLRSERVDQRQIETRLRAISDIRYKIGVEATKHLLQAKAFLKPDQQEAFFNMFMRMHGGPQGMGPERRGGNADAMEPKGEPSLERGHEHE